MATSTPLDSEMALLVAGSGRTAVPQITISPREAPVAKTPLFRHKQLLKLLQSQVYKSCPKDLRNDQDDIAQVVLHRLVKKLDEFEGQLGQLLEHPRQNGGAKLLQDCLRQLETFGNRKSLRKILLSMRKCLLKIEDRRAQERLDPVEEQLRACHDRLRELDGKVVFASYYVKRSVSWAIKDKRAEIRRRREVQQNDNEDGLSNVPQPRTSETKRLVVRQAIQDCLTKMADHMREPTILALQGHTIPEIAILLKLGREQTESRARRGRDLLRKCLNRKGVRRWDQI